MTEHTQRIADFIKAVKASQQVWLLAANDALLMTAANLNDEQDVLLVWHQQSQAEAACNSQWQDFQAIDFSLEEFQDLLIQLNEDNVLIGLDGDEEQIAIEVSANQLINELSL